MNATIRPKMVGDRGFLRDDFRDTLGVDCSIQESSLSVSGAIAPHLWLGRNKGHHTPDGMVCLARMHLDRETAAALIPLLQHFVDYGRLPAPTKEPQP